MGWKPNNTGRSTGTMKKTRRAKIEGPFVAHSMEMLSSPAWGSLNLADRKILDRLQIEHMAHAGTENGRLKCTYNDLERHGVRRKSISEALARLEALGFIEITMRGRKAAGEHHYPSQYRLTYVQGNEPATNDWATIKTAEQAAARIDAATARVEKQRTARRKKKSPRGKTPPKLGAETPPIQQNAGGAIAPTGLGAEMPLPYISTGGIPTDDVAAATGQRKPKAQGQGAGGTDEQSDGWKKIGNVLGHLAFAPVTDEDD